MADCGCDFAGTGGELCPVAVALWEAASAAYRRAQAAHGRLMQERGTADVLAVEVPEYGEYDRAREAYRAHVEAA